MNTSLFAPYWAALDKNTTFYWNMLQELPEQRLKQTKQPDAWSPLQVMEHLVAAEDAVVRYLMKKNYSPLQSRSFMPAGMRSLLLDMALRSPLKFKAPKAIEAAPTNTTKPEVLLQQWKDVRGQLRAYQENLPAPVQHKPLFRHPVAGALTLAQTLSFMAEHLQHHQRQVGKLVP